MPSSDFPVITSFRDVKYVQGDCLDWLAKRRKNTIHGVVTDPPFGLEYSQRELELKRNGNKGGVWRLPPAFDGYTRTPLPRYTVLTKPQLEKIETFFEMWGEALMGPLVPGAHVLVASTPLLSRHVSTAIEAAGFERRGVIIRLVQTMRGGDRPKNAHDEYKEVSIIPKAMHEPWLLFRKPLDGRIKENLDAWGTGGLRRPEEEIPLGDVIASSRAPRVEKTIAPHPSLKPQHFMRQVVRAILPLGTGTVLDPFAGSGSTLAAAANLRYKAIGIDRDPHATEIASTAVKQLALLEPATPYLEAIRENGKNGRARKRKKSAPKPS